MPGSPSLAALSPQGAGWPGLYCPPLDASLPLGRHLFWGQSLRRGGPEVANHDRMA